MHGSAGSPDVVKEDVSGILVNFDFGVEGVGGGGLSFASGGVGADLNSILMTKKKFFDTIVFVRSVLIAEAGEMFGNEMGVVETAFADVLADGGEGDDDNGVFGGEVGGEGLVEDGGERVGEGTNRVVFEVMNELAKKVGTVADDEGGRSVGTVRAEAGSLGVANWTDILVVFNYVIFTTVTKWLS